MIKQTITIIAMSASSKDSFNDKMSFIFCLYV